MSVKRRARTLTTIEATLARALVVSISEDALSLPMFLQARQTKIFSDLGGQCIENCYTGQTANTARLLAIWSADVHERSLRGFMVRDTPIQM